MKTVIKTIVGAAFILAASSAIAQQREQIPFYDGENSGALAIASDFYTLNSETVKTSVVDIDSNGTAEIAVKFTDRCEGDKCPTTILFYSGNEWLEIYSEKTESISLDKTLGDVARIESSNGLTWSWFRDRYIGRVSESTIIWDVAEKQPVETLFSTLEEIKTSKSSVQYNLDLDGNGSEEKIVLLTDSISCNGFGRCDGYIFTKENQFAGKIFHYKGELFVREKGSRRELIVNHPTSFMIYAYKEPNVFITDNINAMPVRQKN